MSRTFPAVGMTDLLQAAEGAVWGAKAGPGSRLRGTGSFVERKRSFVERKRRKLAHRIDHASGGHVSDRVFMSKLARGPRGCDRQPRLLPEPCVWLRGCLWRRTARLTPEISEDLMIPGLAGSSPPRERRVTDIRNQRSEQAPWRALLANRRTPIPAGIFLAALFSHHAGSTEKSGYECVGCPKNTDNSLPTRRGTRHAAST